MPTTRAYCPLVVSSGHPAPSDNPSTQYIPLLTCGRVYEKYCLKTLKKLEKYPTSNSCVGMSFHQWKVSKVCKIIFSLQNFRLKWLDALQTIICTHKAQTKKFRQNVAFCGPKKKGFFLKSQKGCAWCVYILLGVRSFLWVYMPPKSVRYLGEPHWFFGDIGKNL